MNLLFLVHKRKVPERPAKNGASFNRKVEKMSLKLSKCDFCKKYNYDDDKKISVCEAFPNGIPYVTLSDDINEECNNGIKFEEDTK